ncbi:hypothetical protein MBAV_002150 [Candidatus Magnetobacterium bavaricum]|uniref:Uncharacterized protein n=1 Tax=Candidatus Magnetobacterium bavaricum TaxID=29290 RepID=A0A0F3GY59_9BACT|nr:hypothetical protein MBAV_002150 [Candidatus Magnetobacterium bavaricum]
MNSQNTLDNKRERPFVISDRLGYLDRSENSGEFVLSTWSATEYGDDETTYREYFEDKLDGYKHDLIKIKNMEPKVLGLVPQDTNDEYFAEVNYFSFPISCTKEGLEAVMITEGILSGESNNYDDLIKNIVELTKHDGVSLKFAIFQRLLEYLNDNEPNELYELLPWEFLDEYLEYIIHLIFKFIGKPYDKTSETTSGDLPDLMFYFSSVSRTLSYNLLSLIEEMEKFGDGQSGDIIDKVHIINRVYSFIDDLDRIDKNKLPWVNNNIKHKWNKTIDLLCNSYLIKIYDYGFKSKHITKYLLSIFKGNLLISKFKRIDNTLDVDHLGNVYRGLLESDKFDIFKTRRSNVSLIYDKMEEIEQQINLKDLDVKVKKQEDIRKQFVAWMNAADICRFYAQYLLFVKIKSSRLENAEKALTIVEDKSKPSYDKAEYYVESLLKTGDKKNENVDRLYYQRLSRMYILKATIYKQIKDKNKATEAIKKAMEALDILRNKDKEKGKDNYQNSYSYSIIRCEILSFMVELDIDTKGIYSREFIDILDKLIANKPEDYLAYNMKYEYYLNIEQNHDKAKDVMNELIEKWDTIEGKQKTVDSLRHRIITDLTNLYSAEKFHSDDNAFFEEVVPNYITTLKLLSFCRTIVAKRKYGLI